LINNIVPEHNEKKVTTPQLLEQFIQEEFQKRCNCSGIKLKDCQKQKNRGQ